MAFTDQSIHADMDYLAVNAHIIAILIISMPGTRLIDQVINKVKWEENGATIVHVIAAAWRCKMI